MYHGMPMFDMRIIRDPPASLGKIVQANGPHSERDISIVKVRDMEEYERTEPELREKRKSSMNIE